MKHVFTFMLTLFLWLPTSFADTWTGVAGLWSNPNNWVDGTVPTVNDDVIIPSGTVYIDYGYQAVARRVQINSGAYLYVQNGCSLTVNAAGGTNADGVWVLGNFEVYGSLIVKNVATGNGIDLASGALNIYASGSASVTNVTGQNAIFINSYSRIVNEGNIFIRDIDDYGIWNDGTLDSPGDISIIGAGSGLVCFFNADFYNDGTFNVKGGQAIAQFFGNSTGINDQNGTLTGSYLNNGLTVSNDAIFDNYGTIQAIWGISVKGISSSGIFTNHESGDIHLQANTLGIAVNGAGAFTNNGNILVDPVVSGYAIHNTHYFHNAYCGRITIHGPIGVSKKKTFLNEGYIFSKSNQVGSVCNGYCINDGVIEDPTNYLSSIFTNNEIVVQRIPFAQVGTPVSNVLQLGAVDDYFAIGCYTDLSLTTSAGSYKMSSNTWIPNVAAQGLGEVYMRVMYLDNFSVVCDEVIEIDIVGVVQPPGWAAMGQSGTPIYEEQAGFSAYPNPFQENLNLTLPTGLEGAYNLRIFTLTGKVLYQQVLQGEVPTQTLQLPDLASGTYWMAVEKGGAVVWREKLVKT